MKKRKSIIILSVIVGILIVFIVAAFLQTPGINRYLGFTGAIEKNMGAENQGGVVLVYKAEQLKDTRSKASYAKQIEARIYLMRVALSEDQNNRLINDAKNVVRQGSNKIRIESTVTSSANAVALLAVKNTDIVFQDASGNEIAPGTIISNIKFGTRMQQYVCDITVTEEGKKDLEDSSGGEISIYDKNAAAEIAKVPAEAFKDGTLTGKITLTDSDANALNQKYLKILAGSRPLLLTLVSADTYNNARAHNAAILAMCACIAAAVLISVFLCVRYRLFGAAATVSLLSCFIILMFFAAVLPFAKMSFLGLSMFALVMFLNAGAYILSFENIREEFKKGKSVQASIASGFKRSLWPLIDIHLFALIAGAGLWILGEGAAASAGMILLFASILSMGAAAAMCRYLVNLTVNLWGEDTNPALFNLKRPAGFKETDIVADEIAKAERREVTE